MSTEITVTTVEGQRLDSICWAQYGHLDGTVEGVLAANPRLGLQLPHLPGGLTIILPQLARPTRGDLRVW